MRKLRRAEGELVAVHRPGARHEPLRILDDELVDSLQRGDVDFAIPYLRDDVRSLDPDPARPS